MADDPNEIKRFDLELRPGAWHDDLEMIERPWGEWVKHSALVALIAERDALREYKAAREEMDAFNIAREVETISLGGAISNRIAAARARVEAIKPQEGDTE